MFYEGSMFKFLIGLLVPLKACDLAHSLHLEMVGDRFGYVVKGLSTHFFICSIEI